MRDVDHHHSADLVTDLADSLKIQRSAVGACSGNDHFRLAFQRDAAHFIIIDKAIRVDPVGNRMEIAAGKVCGASVRQMTAVIEAHTHESIARL